MVPHRCNCHLQLWSLVNCRHSNAKIWKDEKITANSVLLSLFLYKFRMSLTKGHHTWTLKWCSKVLLLVRFFVFRLVHCEHVDKLGDFWSAFPNLRFDLGVSVDFKMYMLFTCESVRKSSLSAKKKQAELYKHTFFSSKTFSRRKIAFTNAYSIKLAKMNRQHATNQISDILI